VDDPDANPVRAALDTAWLQPFPDSLLGRSDDPAEIVASRSSLRLALIASLQYLPARQRAVLVLRDVLAFSAMEVADILGMSVPAVKSALQRARTRLEDVAPIPDEIVEPDSPEARAILDGYIAAFETADAEALQKLLRSDASLQMTPTRTWFSGKRTCAPFLARRVLHAPGEYRMFPTIANGQPAAVAYRRNDDDVLAPFAIAVLSTDEMHITGITVFADPMLVQRFGYPEVLPAERPEATGERRPAG
jgi:RNA polymerase sigma-70 factor, ECF subfamily